MEREGERSREWGIFGRCSGLWGVRWEVDGDAPEGCYMVSR